MDPPLMRLTPRVLVVFTIHELHSLSEPLTFVVTLQAQLLTLVGFCSDGNILNYRIYITMPEKQLKQCNIKSIYICPLSLYFVCLIEIASKNISYSKVYSNLKTHSSGLSPRLADWGTFKIYSGNKHAQTIAHDNQTRISKCSNYLK